MNYEIKTYKLFDKEVKRLSKKYKSLKDDLEAFRQDLVDNPYQGVDLGGGVHKVRMAIASKGKGKSGGARVITLIVSMSDDKKEIGLHYIYDKSEIESISSKDIKKVLEQNQLL